MASSFLAAAQRAGTPARTAEMEALLGRWPANVDDQMRNAMKDMHTMLMRAIRGETDLS